MASRTQLRLGQITGSFGDFQGGIVDNLAAQDAALGAITGVSGSAIDILSHLASSIKRVAGGTAAKGFAAVPASTLRDSGGQDRITYANGANVFIKDDAGNTEVEISGTDATFSGLIKQGTLTLGSNELDQSSGDFTLDVGGNIILDADSGAIRLQDATTDRGRIDFSAEHLVISSSTSDKDIIFKGNDGGVQITALTLDMSAGGAATFTSSVTAVGLDAGDGNITNVGDIALDSISADGNDINVAITDARGTAFTIKQGTDAYVIVDTTDSSEAVSIGTGISGTAITLGHSTSETTVADNLTVAGNATVSGNAVVTGDLTVNGTTTTIDTTNTKVKDAVILLGSGSSSTGAGIAITSGSATSNNSMVFGRISNDVWGVGRKDVQDGVVTSLADMNLVTLRSTKLELDGTNDHISVDTDLKIVAAADIVLDPGGNDVVPGSNNADALGSDALNWTRVHAGVLSSSISAANNIDFGANGSQQILKHRSGNVSIKNAAPHVPNNSGLIGFIDTHFTGSTFAGAAGGAALAIANDVTEYNSFVSNFGSVSIINAINAARAGTDGAGKFTNEVTASHVAEAVFTVGSGYTRLNVPEADRKSLIDVFVNGQLLLSGATGSDDYYLVSDTQIKFNFDLERDDVVSVIVR